jgi:hypothetical protein
VQSMDNRRKDALTRSFSKSIYTYLIHIRSRSCFVNRLGLGLGLVPMRVYISTNNIARGMVHGSQVRFQSTKSTLSVPPRPKRFLVCLPFSTTASFPFVRSASNARPSWQGKRRCPRRVEGCCTTGGRRWGCWPE